MNAVTRIPRAVGAGAGAFLTTLWPLDIPVGDEAIADLDYVAAMIQDARIAMLGRLSATDGATRPGPAVAERPAAVKQPAVAGHPSITSQLGVKSAEQLEAWARCSLCPRPLYCRALAASLRRLL